MLIQGQPMMKPVQVEIKKMKMMTMMKVTIKLILKHMTQRDSKHLMLVNCLFAFNKFALISIVHVVDVCKTVRR